MIVKSAVVGSRGPLSTCGTRQPPYTMTLWMTSQWRQHLFLGADGYSRVSNNCGQRWALSSPCSGHVKVLKTGKGIDVLLCPRRDTNANSDWKACQELLQGSSGTGTPVKVPTAGILVKLKGSRSHRKLSNEQMHSNSTACGSGLGRTWQLAQTPLWQSQWN